MRCAVEDCTHEAKRQCADCTRRFCGKHVKACHWCSAFVCFACREEHQAQDHLHEEGTPNA